MVSVRPRRLKAFTSVAVLLMSVMMGLEKFNRRTAIVVVAISAGVALASLGELNLSVDLLPRSTARRIHRDDTSSLPSSQHRSDGD